MWSNHYNRGLALFMITPVAAAALVIFIIITFIVSMGLEYFGEVKMESTLSLSGN
jgi:hypothetical protein